MSEKTGSSCTTFLFSDPSFVKGMGTVFNVWGNYYTFNYSSSEEEADARAIASDWTMVGKDIQHALSKAPDHVEHVFEDS